MKRFFILFSILILTLCNLSVSADELPIRARLNDARPTFSNKYSVVKFFQDHVESANKTNIENFIKFYSQDYISNDGFNLASTTALFKELWKQYGNIKYKNNVNSVAFFGDTALVNVTETATATLLNDKNKKGELKSFVDVIYYLKRDNKSWIITGENIITEQINILWGDAKSVATHFEAPQLVGAGEDYSATLFIAPPQGILAIGSISSEVVSYPQRPQKDVFRKFSPDYSIERIITANTENTNEYVIATIGYSRSLNSNNSNLSGFACLIRRVNVVPKNKFININDDKKQAK